MTNITQEQQEELEESHIQESKEIKEDWYEHDEFWSSYVDTEI